MTIREAVPSTRRNPKLGDAPRVRTTVVLPKNLDQNIEAFCMMRGVGKAEVIKNALCDFLQREGLEPMKAPRAISIEY
jgi:hypothetical protein